MSHAAPRLVAVLGPTNTGKTHLAMERMLGHASGMIGFPLRLLARENYDRAVAIKGPSQVALVTGEEKILPAHARYFVCTVESMPVEKRVSFLAIDEIQLAADPERGHIFTDRLLHARGEAETMFLGADTARALISKLVPGVEFISRPRFSQLTYAGERKITRLPPRSAIVAFSADEVYELADTVRRRRGGAAVVMGALSPRTRNAQVGMYQAGEVDYLVATDAIGMGLNLDVGHVAFARLTKFDGAQRRRLTAAELAQIAGRAGRHMQDGTFGTTGEAGPLDIELARRVEDHNFDSLKAFVWRNADLDFASHRRLLASLEMRSDSPFLVRGREVDDYLALKALVADPAILRRLGGPDTVRLLWDACQIPDFRKVMSETHARLVGQVFLYLLDGAALPVDWVAGQIARLDRTDGDIDTLMSRIAHIRTWTYIAHRGDWLADPPHWQTRARQVEDRLSDALHARLTQRFVDRRAAFLVQRLRGAKDLTAALDAESAVDVEGQHVGHLKGFSFEVDSTPAAGAWAEDRRALMTAANRALSGEIARRLAQALAASNGEFALDAKGLVSWKGEAVGRLRAGSNVLAPRVEVLPSALLDSGAQERLRQRLVSFLSVHLEAGLAPLLALSAADLPGRARGVAYQLVEQAGVMARVGAPAWIGDLTREERNALFAHDVAIGWASVYVPAVLKPHAMALRAILWQAAMAEDAPATLAARASPFAAGEAAASPAMMARLGYVHAAALWVRVDLVERFARRAAKLARAGAFVLDDALAQSIGVPLAEAAELLVRLGFRQSEAGTYLAPRRRAARPAAVDLDAQSPFAVLREVAR